MKSVLALLLLMMAFMSHSQDSLSKNVRSFRVYSGAPFKKAENENAWYNPDLDLGFEVQHSIKLKNAFFVSFGFGANYSQYRSEAYVQTWTTLSYSPLTGSTGYFHSDDFERQTLGRFLGFRVPVQVEYMPKGRWKPYAKLGVTFDMRLQNYTVEVYANTTQSAPEHYHAVPKRVYNDQFLLSAISSGGMKCQIGNTSLLFGVYGQVGVWNFNNKRDVGRINVGAEFTIRKRIRL